MSALPAGPPPPKLIRLSWTTGFRRLAAVVVAVVALIVVSAGPASAHARLLASDPPTGPYSPPFPIN